MRFMQRCLRDRSAGVALMFAITAIPVIGVIGIAIDFGLATQAKTQLNLATDAAALAAAKGAADAFSAGQSVESARATGQAAGVEWFKSQAGTVFGATLQDPVVTVQPPNGGVFTSQVSYQGSVRPYFAPLFGVSSVALAGSSSATITTNAYVSVTFLLDNSSSMLIAATQAGVNQMHALTPVSTDSSRLQGPKRPEDVPDGLGVNRQCAFACHWDINGNDYYGLARGNNIQLRFDVLQEAAALAITQMKDQKKIDNQFAVTVYTFATSLTQIYPADQNQPASTNLDDGVAAVQAFKTPVVIDDGNTNFPAVMSDLANNRSTAAGDGSSMANRKKALIIVTDGLADYGNPRSIPDRKGPIKPADCAAMKNKGYNVYVLYTTYITDPRPLLLPFDNDGLYDYINSTASSAMISSLQACASAPSNFAQASDPTAIKTAMSQMLQAALNNGGRYIQ